MQKQQKKLSELDEERLSADVIEKIARNKMPEQVAKECGIRRQDVMKYIRIGFKLGLVKHNPHAGTLRFEELEQTFQGIKIEIISAKYEFERRAAITVFTWLKEAYKRIPSNERTHGHDRSNMPAVAVGGGEAMLELCKALGNVFVEPGGAKLKQWLESRDFFIVNATAGGQPWLPRLEASRIAVMLGEALEKPVGVYSVLRVPTPEEAQLVDYACKNTFFILSGVGEKKNAYCLKAMTSALKLTEEQLKDVVGEFLFHPFDDKGRPVLDGSANWVSTKELSDAVASHQSDQSIPTPLFASLFSMENFKTPFRSNWPRYVVGVVRNDESNVEEKAKSVLSLLRAKRFTHICISVELAQKLQDLIADTSQR